MRTFLVAPSKVSGELTIPPSKSQTLRAILFGTLASGQSTITNYLKSPDSEAMIRACRSFGAQIVIEDRKLIIQGINGEINCAEDVIHAGNSGIVLRFCSALGALSKRPIVVTGDDSIKYQRPMKALLSGLKQLGVSAESMRGDDYAPVIIKGPIVSNQVQIEGTDSQPVSALLIASAFARTPIEIRVENPGEIPWVQLTLHWFDKFAIPYSQVNFQQYSIQGNSKIQGFNYNVAGDLSSLAFPIAAALVTDSELTIHNVDLQEIQGDKELIYTLQKMGAKIEIDEKKNQLTVQKGTHLKGITVDMNNYIDAVPILAVIACFAEGTTLIHNASIARHKESNRLHTIKTELKKMGAKIEETDDGLIIQHSQLFGAKLYSYNDHRIAMSLTIAAMGATGESQIEAVDCVSKTYPDFLKEFQKLGANIR